MTPQMVDDFLSSPEMPKGERTRQDYRLWALRFAEAFQNDPARMFEEPEARGEVNDWRAKWRGSPRQYDYAGTVVTRILNWAWKDAGKIRMHHCGDFRKVYKADRSEIVWTPQQREAVCAIAPEWVQRILISACETGLRPYDLVRLSRGQIEVTPHGRRIRIRTNKRKRIATIPVTPEMGAVIDATPADRLMILVNANGGPLAARHANEMLRYYRDKAGLTEEALGYALRLQDCRGTAATRLLNAGLSLAEPGGDRISHGLVGPLCRCSHRALRSCLTRRVRCDSCQTDPVEEGCLVNETVNGTVNAGCVGRTEMAQVTENTWRRVPKSNRSSRICNPLRNLSANPPR